MIDILLAGVGGQGTVLAAKVLAQAAESKGWRVRTAETIGMAQRGGSVTSHVRMGNEGEDVAAPLLSRGTADIVIAFEPGEAARAVPYLAPTGIIVTARTPVQPVTSALAGTPYDAEKLLANIGKSLNEGMELIAVDDAALTKAAGSRKALNIMLLAKAIATGRIPLSIDDLRAAVTACVKPRFIDMNQAAITLAIG